MNARGRWLVWLAVALLLGLAAGLFVVERYEGDRYLPAPQGVRAGPISSVPAPAVLPQAGSPLPSEAPKADQSAGPLTAGQVQALRASGARLADGNASNNADLTPLRAWAAQDPAACARWVLKNLDGTARQRALEETVAVWLKQQNPRGVLDWLDQQTPARADTASNAGAYALALATLAEQDGPGAVAWLRGHPVQGSTENWSNVLGAWAEAHATDALQWVSTPGNVAPELKDALLPGLLTNFHDPGTTDMLLGTSQPAVVEDALIRAARATVQLDPIYSLGLARQIQDQAARNAAIGRALGRWLETDPTAARSFAERAGLPLPASAAQAQSAGQAQPMETTPPEVAPVLPRP